MKDKNMLTDKEYSKIEAEILSYHAHSIKVLFREDFVPKKDAHMVKTIYALYSFMIAKDYGHSIIQAFIHDFCMCLFDRAMENNVSKRAVVWRPEVVLFHLLAIEEVDKEQNNIKTVKDRDWWDFFEY